MLTANCLRKIKNKNLNSSVDRKMRELDKLLLMVVDHPDNHFYLSRNIFGCSVDEFDEVKKRLIKRGFKLKYDDIHKESIWILW